MVYEHSECKVELIVEQIVLLDRRKWLRCFEVCDWGSLGYMEEVFRTICQV